MRFCRYNTINSFLIWRIYFYIGYTTCSNTYTTYWLTKKSWNRSTCINSFSTSIIKYYFISDLIILTTSFNPNTFYKTWFGSNNINTLRLIIGQWHIWIIYLIIIYQIIWGSISTPFTTIQIIIILIWRS